MLWTREEDRKRDKGGCRQKSSNVRAHRYPWQRIRAGHPCRVGPRRCAGTAACEMQRERAAMQSYLLLSSGLESSRCAHEACLLDVVAGLGTGFNKHHIQLLCSRFALLCRHLPSAICTAHKVRMKYVRTLHSDVMTPDRIPPRANLATIGKIRLVAHKHDDHILSALVAHVINPLCRVLERGLVCGSAQTRDKGQGVRGKRMERKGRKCCTV